MAGERKRPTHTELPDTARMCKRGMPEAAYVSRSTETAHVSGSTETAHVSGSTETAHVSGSTETAHLSGSTEAAHVSRSDVTSAAAAETTARHRRRTEN